MLSDVMNYYSFIRDFKGAGYFETEHHQQTEKDFKIPTQPERRERMLQALIKMRQKPIALFVDEAHDRHNKTLIGLKRLIEVVQDGDGILSIILAGHPKLKNDLRLPAMEEIGSRTTVFTLEGIQGQKTEYIQSISVKISLH